MSTRLEQYEGAAELAGQVVFEREWYLLTIPADAHATLLALLDPLNVDHEPAARPHISIMKREAPSLNRTDWGVAFVGELVTFRYHGVVRDENGLHLWVDCHSRRLCQMREHFGLVTLKREDGTYLVNFHLTVALRTTATAPRRRPHLRLVPQSHIDVETGMQHL
jgi:hypothetical protein